jgi:hypothetical protein
MIVKKMASSDGSHFFCVNNDMKKPSYHHPSLHALLACCFMIISLADLVIMPILMAYHGKVWASVTMTGAGAPTFYGAWGAILSIGVWRRYGSGEHPPDPPTQ